MLKRFCVALVLVLSLVLTSCSASPILGGLKSYTDAADGYQFLYPIGWIPVKVSSGGADVVFRDLIEETENVSVVINPVPPTSKTLQDLGTPGEVGYQLGKKAIAPPGSGREAELVSASSHESPDGKLYYTLEYAVKLPNRLRHNLASVVVNRGNLYTFSVSTNEQRWPKVKALFETIINSFSVS
ncbi:MAG: photosystem II reaction center PsbP [Leptolyngbyaceae cyanobacterium bins.59]|nr:photosystem II reaction center PsbP [Leptolyngbyaceae cyanobacterium bins.59]